MTTYPPEFAPYLAAGPIVVGWDGSPGADVALAADWLTPGWQAEQAFEERPASQLAARYTERGITLVQTPQCGAARWVSGQPQDMHCERQAGRRYWHHAVP